jgi:HEAT repeat protein
MKKVCSILIMLLLVIVVPQSGHPQPRIPVDKIPANIPAEVRAHIKELYSETPAKRMKAALEIGKLGEKAKDAVPFLIGMLYDSDFVLQQSDHNIKVSISPAKASMLALIRIGSLAVMPLIAACRDENIDTRKYAVEALGNIKDARAVESLVAALKDKKTVVREYAHKALMQVIEGLKERQDEKQLIGMLQYERPSVRIAVIEALGNVPRTRVAENLVPFLENGDSYIRKKSADALKKIGEAAVVPLINALYNDDIQVRINAAMVLGDIKDTLSVNPLIETLKYKSRYSSIEPATLRLEAAVALGKIRDCRAVEPLVAALSDNNFHVIERAAEALTAIGEKSVEPLIKVLKDENETQVLAAKILGDIKDPRAVEPLMQTLLLAAADNKSWNFRYEATLALGKIKDPRAVDVLEIMLSDKVSNVREIAEWSLNEISGKTSTDQKKKDNYWNNLF